MLLNSQRCDVIGWWSSLTETYSRLAKGYWGSCVSLRRVGWGSTARGVLYCGVSMGKLRARQPYQVLPRSCAVAVPGLDSFARWNRGQVN
jgi:hypothetical protein